MESLRNHLGALGFSPYEIDIYLALLQEGPANGSQLARRAGVPRSMVYQTLDRLVEKSAVLIAPGDPALYAPINPAEYFTRLQERYADSCQALIQGLPSLPNAADNLVWNLKGLDAIRHRALDLYFRARGQALTGGDAELLAYLLPGANPSNRQFAPGWCVIAIPHQEALMVEVTPFADPVGAYSKQSAFVAAATALAKQPASVRQLPWATRQFW